MLVITDVKYDVHDDKQRGDYFEYYTPTFEPITLRPPQGGLPDWSPRTERVIPHTYWFTLPKQDVEYSNRVRALKPFGLEIDDVSNYNSDTLIKCSIQIGVVGSRDENVVLTILKMLQESSDSYLQKMMEANQSASKSAARVLELEAQLTESNRWYQEMLSDVRLARRASPWQRLKWLFTGVQI